MCLVYLLTFYKIPEFSCIYVQSLHVHMFYTCAAYIRTNTYEEHYTAGIYDDRMMGIVSTCGTCGIYAFCAPRTCTTTTTTTTH